MYIAMSQLNKQLTPSLSIIAHGTHMSSAQTTESTPTPTATPAQSLPAFAFTKMPNAFFEHMSTMSVSEMRVYCFLVRQTAGWHRPSITLSYNQIANEVKLSQRAVINAVKELQRRGLIDVVRSTNSKKGDMPNTYVLKVEPIDETSDACEAPERVLEGQTPSEPEFRPYMDSDINRYIEGSKKKENNKASTNSQQADEQADNDVVATDKSCSGKTECEKHEQMSEEQTALMDALRKYGVNRNVARKLTRNYEPEYIQSKLEMLQSKLDEGWKPRVSEAAWLVAAIRDDYQEPCTEQPEERERKTIICPNCNDVIRTFTNDGIPVCYPCYFAGLTETPEIKGWLEKDSKDDGDDGTEAATSQSIDNATQKDEELKRRVNENAPSKRIQEARKQIATLLERRSAVSTKGMSICSQCHKHTHKLYEYQRNLLCPDCYTAEKKRAALNRLLSHLT